MKNTMIALGVCAALLPVTSSFAASPDFYGRMWLATSYSDNGLISARSTDGTVLENYASFLGVKGKEALTDKVNIIYVMEVGNEGGFYNASELFKPRNTYLGVEGGFGTFMFGRNDTVFKKTEGKVDLFNITSSDMAALIDGNARIGDTATYYSPKIAGVQFGATYQFADSAADSSGDYALSATLGDKALQKTPYYAAIAYADGLNQLDAYRAVVVAKLAGVNWGMLVQHASSDKYDNLSGNSYLFSAAMPFGDYTAKLQYARDNSGLGKVVKKVASLASVTDTDSYMVSAGVDVKLSKSTTAGVIVSYLDGDVTDASGYQEFDDTQLSVHLKYLF
ncbi:porin [Shewanella sp. A3A]|nr:porin [Shewanella ferrihydritica]